MPEQNNQMGTRFNKKFYGEKLQEGLYRIQCKACDKIYNTCFGDDPFCSLLCRDAGKIAQRLTSRRERKG